MVMPVSDTVTSTVQVSPRPIANILPRLVSTTLKRKVACLGRAGDVSSLNRVDTPSSSGSPSYTTDTVGRAGVAGLSRREVLITTLRS